jgi:hypothetical protein
VPAIRVAAQILGVVAGRSTGMMIIQCTQIITVLGGPAGYMYVLAVFLVPPVTRIKIDLSMGTNNHAESLVVNIIAGEIVEPERRTATFGKLQGCIMLGQGLGFLGKKHPPKLRETPANAFIQPAESLVMPLTSEPPLTSPSSPSSSLPCTHA